MLRLIEAASPDLASSGSQTTLAYRRVRADILAGRLVPGERLKIADLAAVLAVSPGAIREALSRLVPEQLVVSRDQKGFIVAPLSVEDLHDLTELRCDIEAIALRRAVANGDAGWEATILASAHRLRRTPMTSQANHALEPEWVERHAAFHAALVGACGSRRMLDLHTQLYQQAERYRGLSVHVESGRDVNAEHQLLVDLALDRNVERLVEAAIAHFRSTTALIARTTALIVDVARDAPKTIGRRTTDEVPAGAMATVSTPVED